MSQQNNHTSDDHISSNDTSSSNTSSNNTSSNNTSSNNTARTGVEVVADRFTALRDYIGTARWFGGKGRSFTIDAVTDLTWLSDPAAGHWPAVRTEIVELSYPQTAGLDDGLGTDADTEAGELAGPAGLADTIADDSTDDPATDFYQLAMSYRRESDGLPEGLAAVCRIEDPEQGALIGVDATLDPAARRVLLIRLLGQYAATSEQGSVAFRLRDRDQVKNDGLHTDLSSSVFGGQQSNTSIMFGDVAMLKLFRRLELGRNLDIEAHQVLNDAGLGGVARLYGWIEGTWRTGGGARHTADFAMVVEKLREATDGWDLALERLSAGEDFAADAGALGRALRETHQALRTHFVTDTIAGEELADVMNDRLRAAISAAPQLEDYAAGLRACFDELRGRDLDTQRVHGDFHLGQTLHTPDGWKIIDFEGEPAKTMAERVAPDSIWRDVAGLLRSFDYAAASVPDSTSAGADWAKNSQDAVLAGYAGGASLDPDADRLLRAYVADKAVYEVVYEVRNRPDWVHIPLAAVAGLTQT